VDEWGDLVCVHSFQLTIYKFIQAGVHIRTGKIIRARLFEYVQELEDDLICQFRLGIEFVANSLKKTFYVHSNVETINNSLILLWLESSQDVLRRQIFEGEPLFEPQAGIMQKLVKGVAVGVHPFGGNFHRNIL